MMIYATYIEEVDFIMLQNDWRPIFEEQMEQPYFQELWAYVQAQYNEATIYPEKENIFKAFEMTSYAETKVVILGQDPYHGPNQAHGLSFSVVEGQKFPPSLRNMLTELVDDIGCEMPQSGNLTKWAQQGVLLLNTVLTVQQGQPNSHQKRGWELFTDAILQRLAEREQPIVFMLWGKPAQTKEKIIEKYQQHTILKSAHPSPLSAYRGFFGSKPYSSANEALVRSGQQPINWCL